jgi:hypothetical protein
MELEDLRAIAEESKKKKGRMDSIAREKAADLLSRIWTGEDCDPTTSFGLLNDLQSEAIADGIGKAWPQMGESRRKLFLSGLPAPSTERASRRIALIAASVMDADGRTANELLSKLFPAGRKTMNKEVRQILGAVLFGDRRPKFENLCQADIPLDLAIRVCSQLMDVAFDHSSNVSPVLRSKLAIAILNSLERLQKFDPAKGAEIESQIADEIKRWPSALRVQFENQLKVLETKTETQTSLPDQLRPVEEPFPQKRIDATSPIVKGNALERLASLEGQFSSRLSAISNDLQYLKGLSIELAAFRNEYRAIQNELEVMAQQSAQFAERARHTSEANRHLDCQLEQQTRKALELGKELDRYKTESEEERKRLSQQITANASGRIDEFKTRLGLVLARLVVDLPQKEVAVSPELGKVLLLQFHQFLEALRNEGVETRPRNAART